MQTIIKVITIILLFFISKINGQENNVLNEKLSEYLSIQNERLNFNGVVLVANEDNILYEKAIGLASHELQVPLTMESKFKIASISKSFTGVLTAMAVQEGKLTLDAKIGPYFPKLELGTNWDQITIRQLVSHTSGIPHWEGFEGYWTKNSLLRLDTNKIVSLMFKMDLLFSPGFKVHYSSPAYYLLATILESVYNSPYEKLIKTKITNKLQLKNTGVFNDLAIIKNMAQGYHALENEKLIAAPYRNTVTLKGGGNLYSNAADLLKWNRSMINGTSWNDSLIEQIFTKSTNKKMPHNNNAFYGMGWYMHSNIEERPNSYQVAGGTYGYSSISTVYPKEKISIIILSNISTLPVNEIWNDVEKIVFNKPFKMPELIIAKPISKESLENLSGVYIAKNGMKLKVGTHENELYVALGKKPPFKIVADNELVFLAKKMNITFTFKKDAEGQIKRLTTMGRGEKHEFNKLKK